LSVLIPEDVWLTRFYNKKLVGKVESKPDAKGPRKPEPKSEVEKDPVAALLSADSVSGAQKGPAPGPSPAAVPPAVSPPKPVEREPEQLTVLGETVSQMAVARFLTVLEQSHYFTGARLVSTEQVKNVSPPKFKFEISIPIRSGAEGRRL